MARHTSRRAVLARRILGALLVLAFVFPAPATHARDWFVRPGVAGGDGTREKPFGDPWMALERVEANDKVHVAAGKYFGKLEKGNWEIPFPGVELLGGYDANFQERNPWKNLTELTWRKGSANRPDVSLARISTSTRRDTSGATIDGFFIDMQDYYDYLAEGSFNPEALQRNGAVDLAKNGVLRNCMIVNSLSAVQTSPGALVENNVIVNSIYAAVIARRGGDRDEPVTIRNNTIAFVWATQAIAQGGTEGAGLDVTKKAVVEGNLIVHADNHGAFIGLPATATFARNAFWRNLYSNVTFNVDGKKSSLGDSDIGDDEDVGFAKGGGNVAVDPKLPFDPTWYERFLRRANLGPKFDAKAWADTRASAGLPPEAGEAITLFAPAYPPEAVPALIAPRTSPLEQGARARKLAVGFSAVAAAAPAKKYTTAELSAFTASPERYDGKDLEIVAGIVGVTAVLHLPEVSDETHKAVSLTDAKGENRTVAIFKKGTSVERFIDAVPSYGSGPPRDLFVIRGTARVPAEGYPKHAIVVDSIAPFEKAVEISARPQGRDWYVRAGESGGVGTREKPFRDPFQALEKAEPGDRINVAEGEYGGKLKSGKWVVDKKYLALLGGWDREFKKRDPWNTPTLLYWPPDSKTTPQGHLLEGSGDHTGLVVDGFVFDRRTLNTYDKDGFLDVNTSPDEAHVSVFSPESVVRNCTFVNGAGAAIRMTNGVTFENNIVANVFDDGIKVTGGSGTRPAEIRNNSILFVFNVRRPHSGTSSSGSGIVLGGNVPAVVDGNVIQYVDNFAVTSEIRPSELVLTNNSYFRNWSTFRWTEGAPPPTVDEKSMQLLDDLPFKKVEGNVVADGGFEIEPAFYASWFARTSALTSRFSAEEWKAIAPPDAGGGVKPGVGMALDWRKAAKLVPTNAQVKGARPKKLE